MTTEPAFSRHAEASAGSQSEFRVVKKKTKNRGSCSVLCRQPADRKEGRNSYYAATCRKLLATFIFNSSSKASTPFIFEVLWKCTLHAGKKGELELSSKPPPPSITQYPPLGPTSPLFFLVFLCYLFGFSVAHRQWGWLSGQMVLSVWTRSWDREGQTPRPSWDAAVWPRGILEWTRWALMRSNSWNSLETI